MIERELRTVVVAIAAMCAAACGGADGTVPDRPAPKPIDRFDADAAWRTIELQLRYGQRPAGSPQLRRLGAKLRQRR